MNRKSAFLKAVASCLLLCAVACQNQEIPIPVQSEETVSHSISVEDALATLKSFMKDECTRTTDVREVSNVLTVKYKSASTRSGCAIPDCENLIYVANFENEQGYAILAADDRIDDPVLAITDEGNLTDENVDAAVDAVVNQERPFFEGYPSSGPGFFTTPETGDEVFMNPNTVNLYDAAKDDTLVGNFKISAVAHTSLSSRTDSAQIGYNTYDNAVLSTVLCMKYAEESLRKNIMRKPSVPGPPEYADSSFIGTTYYTQEIEATRWIELEKIYPMLSAYSNWHQGSPFNDFFDYRYEYLVFGHKDKAPAGCVPLSVAKIFTKFVKPGEIEFRNMKVNLDDLNTDLSLMTDLQKKSAAALLRYIADQCGSIQFYEGTFTLPLFARLLMERKGYNNVVSRDYSLQETLRMLRNGKPLMIFSIPQWNITQSHCWNLDGYKKKTRTVTTKYFKNYVLYKIDENQETLEMIHCDFGWGGTANGYYVAGIFNLRDPRRELDNPDWLTPDYNYDKFLHIITYDL